MKEAIAAPGVALGSEGARRAFLALFDRALDDATLQVVEAGASWTVGHVEPSRRRLPDAATLVVQRSRFYARVLSFANLGLAEAYMDEDFEVPGGALPDLLTILVRARVDQKVRGDWRLALRVLGIRVANRLAGPWRNVERHFDAGDELIESFLDPTLSYTCGYARSADDDLATLQRQKLERICAKLALRSGERLLDVGCGYGGLLIHAALHHGVSGVGVTNSRRHFERARARVAEAGLEGRVEIRLADHRELRGRFEKVVSVGMLEHMPRSEHGRYFARMREVLEPGGLGLAHFIGCGVASNEHDPFIQKYIFPGSCQLKLSEVSDHLERNELAILDVENMVRHYGLTCARWLEGLRRARTALDPHRFDTRFQRMYEYYLSLCVAAARASDGALYQVLYGNDFAAERPLARV